MSEPVKAKKVYFGHNWLTSFATSGLPFPEPLTARTYRNKADELITEPILLYRGTLDTCADCKERTMYLFAYRENNTFERAFYCYDCMAKVAEDYTHETYETFTVMPAKVGNAKYIMSAFEMINQELIDDMGEFEYVDDNEKIVFKLPENFTLL